MLGMSTPMGAAITGGGMFGGWINEKISPTVQESSLGQKMGDWLAGTGVSDLSSGNEDDMNRAESRAGKNYHDIWTSIKEGAGMIFGSSSSQVDVQVSFANAPKGLKTITTSSGNVNAQIKTQESMPLDGP
jgi:hypothetical protein